MTTTTKVTKKDNFNAIIGVLKDAGRDDLVAVMEHEVELLEKKSSNKKATANQKANVVLDQRILAYIESAESPVSATEIMEGIDYSGIEGLDTKPSLPRITNRITALGKEGKKLDRLADSKGAKFTLGTGLGFKAKAE